MVLYLFRRLIHMGVALFVLATLIFFLVRALPGGPFDREKTLPPEIMRNLEAYYGLDQPLGRQYLDFLWGALRGDFGPSYTSRTDTVTALILRHLPVSAELGLWALLLAVAAGIPLGVLAAYYHNSPVDVLATLLAVLGRSVPPIALSPLLILIFGLYLQWFPIARFDTPAHRVLPALALGLGMAALIARLARSSMLQVIREDYIRTARAKGLPERIVVASHAMRNAAIPVITVTGLQIGALLSGAIITESIFDWPGLGSLLLEAIYGRNYALVQGCVLVIAVSYIAVNLLTDLLYGWVDPRIRQA